MTMNGRQGADSKVIIIGGGIGGLATAISLRAIGVGVEVYERAARLRVTQARANKHDHTVIPPNGTYAASEQSRCRLHAKSTIKVYAALDCNERANADHTRRLVIIGKEVFEEAAR